MRKYNLSKISIVSSRYDVEVFDNKNNSNQTNLITSIHPRLLTAKSKKNKMFLNEHRGKIIYINPKIYEK